MVCGRNPVLFFHVNSCIHEKILFSASFTSQVYINVWLYFWVLDHMLAVLLSSPSPVSSSVQFSSIQLLSHVQLFAIPWITACQASLSITNSRSSLRLKSIESVMPSSHLWWLLVIPFSSCPQSIPASESFPMSQLVAWGGQSTGVSTSVSFLPKKSQGWSPSEWTGWISL